jgi:tRNA threonylcarbamoyladenosine biosynthesis protein TsaE
MRAMQKMVRKEDMAREAAAFVETLTPREAATMVTLSGDLGAGKTTFVQEVARVLGITEHVTSPTFVIMKIYDLEGQAFKRLIHMDAYRLKGKQHLKVLGWDDLVADPANLIFIEWPEKIEGAIPQGARAITFGYSGEGRELIYG